MLLLLYVSFGWSNWVVQFNKVGIEHAYDIKKNALGIQNLPLLEITSVQKLPFTGKVSDPYFSITIPSPP